MNTALSKDLCYLTPTQVANCLQVDVRTVQRWALTDPTMPATRLGRKLLRFERLALERWLARKLPRKAQADVLVLSQPAKSA